MKIIQLMAHHNKFYGLDDNGCVYERYVDTRKSTNEVKNTVWIEVISSDDVMTAQEVEDFKLEEANKKRLQEMNNNVQEK